MEATSENGKWSFCKQRNCVQHKAEFYEGGTDSLSLTDKPLY